MLYLHLHVMHRVGWYPRNVTKLWPGRCCANGAGAWPACAPSPGASPTGPWAGWACASPSSPCRSRCSPNTSPADPWWTSRRVARETASGARGRRPRHAPQRHLGRDAHPQPPGGRRRARGRSSHRVRQPRRALGEQGPRGVQRPDPGRLRPVVGLPALARAGLGALTARRRLMPDMADTFAGVFGSDPWVWKDPRTCLTFPLWRRVLGPAVLVVLVLRAPGAVVSSLKRRDGIPTVYALGLVAPLRPWRGATARRDCRFCACTSRTWWRRPTSGVERARRRTCRPRRGPAWRPRRRRRPRCRGELVHDEEPHALVRRLTSPTVEVLRSAAAPQRRFRPPPGRAALGCAPLLFAYRAPWALRARHGPPADPRARRTPAPDGGDGPAATPGPVAWREGSEGCSSWACTAAAPRPPRGSSTLLGPATVRSG